VDGPVTPMGTTGFTIARGIAGVIMEFCDNSSRKS